ncbi:MAG: CHAT domain-containing protein [Desulfobacteraceae bacterium]|nr:CHAT domain-containing protein [Desulfobacteraceae bacterium]
MSILYPKLLGKFDKHIKDLKKIYIAPDGFLHLVPFHTLRLPDGRYWTERQQINILQTGRDLLSPPQTNSSKLFVAVGGVDYGDMPKQPASVKGSDAPPMLNMRAAGELGTGLKYLENSLFEAKTIEELFKSNYPDAKTLVLQGNDATEAALKNLTPAPKILHLSTHGFYLETPQKKTEEWI